MKTALFQHLPPVLGRWHQTAMVMVALFVTLPAMASDFTVSTLSDTGVGSLRQALIDANNSPSNLPHKIAFNSSLEGTIQLDSELPILSYTTSVEGPGSDKVTISRSSETPFRILASAGSSLVVKNLTITNGVAEEGGGIYSSGDLMVDACVITNNSAIGEDAYYSEGSTPANSGRGGGLYADGTLTVTGSTISGNLAKGGDDSVGSFAGNAKGGGIYGGSSVTIAYSSIVGNTTNGGDSNGSESGEGLGGGIYVDGYLDISNSTISGNTAIGGDMNGEALYRASAGRGGGIFSSGDSDFLAVTVSGNTVIGGVGSAGNGNALGGGMDANSGEASVSIVDSVFSDNHLVGTPEAFVGGHAYGSAIRFYFNDVYISRSKFTGNTAISNDAEYVVGSTLDLSECWSYIENSLIAQNVASGNGTYSATVLVEAGNLTLINSTIADNSTVGEGAALFAYEETTEVINSILWGNSQGQFLEMDVNYGSEFSEGGFEGTPGITYSIIEGGYTGTGNINQDPLFVDADNQNYELLPTSPAIDSALDSQAPSTDLLGNYRMDDPNSSNLGGGFADMGAYEFQPYDYLTQLIGLNVGWNLISVPFVPLDPSITGNFGSGAFAYRWDATIQDYVEITTITAGQGFFLFTDNGSSVMLYSQTQASNYVRPMANYWNVIGTTEDEQTFDAVSNVIVVYTYDGTTDSYNLVNPFDGKYTLYGGIGYYIFAFPAFDLTLDSKNTEYQ